MNNKIRTVAVGGEGSVKYPTTFKKTGWKNKRRGKYHKAREIEIMFKLQKQMEREELTGHRTKKPYSPNKRRQDSRPRDFSWDGI